CHDEELTRLEERESGSHGSPSDLALRSALLGLAIVEPLAPHSGSIPWAAGPRLGSGRRDDDAGLGESGDLARRKPGLGENGRVVLAHARGLAQHTWPGVAAKGDGQGWQLYLGSGIATGWRDRDINEATVRHQMRIGEEVAGFSDGRPGDVGTLA